VDYNSRQLEAIDLARERLRAGELLTSIGGYAGTGKTTVIKEIIDQTPNLMTMTFTGKASSVLRRKGVNSCTIHSSIYDWDSDTQEFFLKGGLPCDGIVIDEGSMVGTQVLEDIQSFGIPIIAVGDPGQLEPINDSSTNLLRNPDVILEEIHRQAKGSAIIQLATRIRRGEEIGFQDDDSSCRVLPIEALEESDEQPSIYLCGYNSTRTEINSTFREHLNRKAAIEVGEELICKANSRWLGVFNGLMMRVKKIYGVIGDQELYDCTVEIEGEGPRRLQLWTGGLKDPEKLKDWESYKRFKKIAAVVDYAYAITVHASQGSEWDDVSLINQKAGWDQKRWLYTGVTRAAKNLTVFI